jgi:hypothetical protein
LTGAVGTSKIRTLPNGEHTIFEEEEPAADQE